MLVLRHRQQPGRTPRVIRIDPGDEPSIHAEETGAALAAHRATEVSRVKVDSFFECYVSHCELERRLSPLTIRAYARDLSDFRSFLRINGVGDEVSEASVRAYLVHSNERGLAIVTVKRRFATLRGFFKWAVLEHGVADPFARWHPRIKKPKRLPRALARVELEDLVSVADERRKRRASVEITFLAIIVMAATGVRVGELCAIELEDAAPDGGSLHIRGKGARDRIVYISNLWLKQALARLRTDQARRGMRALFTGRTGNRLSPASVRARMRRLARVGGGTRRVTPHMLRHTAATMLIEEGIDIRVVQRLLGHASVATTELYTHVADEVLKRSLERADVVGSVVRAAQD